MRFNILPRDPEDGNWDTALLPSEGAEAVGQMGFVTSQASWRGGPLGAILGQGTWPEDVCEAWGGTYPQGQGQSLPAIQRTFIFNLRCLSQEILQALKQT